ncbi:hemerythrin HHE cation binding domain protein [Clostridiales bacterium oral taxon 876 str. F0540]|nr:hemerythrin HHE cation binding domain protein [Clostridiales bacterium oral taxon 876 str. F0540]
MSEIINNREYRQKVLKELITELHNGKSAEEVKERFAKLIEGVAPSEISEMEQALIMEGMPIEEVQRLCDVHAAVFKGSIADIHAAEVKKAEEIEGHPIHTFKLENREIESLISKNIEPHLEDFKKYDSKDIIYKIIEDLNLLYDIDKHYSRKENLVFPYLEKYGITAPPKVMWGVDDEIRDAIKEGKKYLTGYNGDREFIAGKISETLNRIKEMIFKEENILFPMCMDTLTEDEWFKIMEESDEIGYTLIEPKTKWKPERVSLSKEKTETVNESGKEGYIKLPTGFLNVKELAQMLNTLPFDITFIDKDDIVKYFSQSEERIFARTKAVIGRSVANCHPPASVHIVEKMLEDFKSGRKNHEDFWINMGPMFVYIRYFAVRDEDGEYLGTVEVTQNIKPIQGLSGEKRLMSE